MGLQHIGDGLSAPGPLAHLCSRRCHGWACPGHPRLQSRRKKSWMPGTRPGMTVARCSSSGIRNIMVGFARAQPTLQSRGMQPSADFDPATAAKKLLREARSGALATLMRGWGDPYCSLVNVATAANGAPLLFISALAVHTKNILADWRVSLMLDERREGDPLEGARVMLMGTAVRTENPAARRRYLTRHPEAEMFASFT